jgi:hypothetical protein
MRNRSIWASILVLGILEIFNAVTFRGSIFWLYFALSLFGLAIVLLWVLRLPPKKWFSKEVITHSIYLILPIIFYASSLIFLLLLRGPYVAQLFIFGSAILFFIILMGERGVILNLEYKIKPRLTYNALALSTILTSFLAYSIIWAFFRDLSFSIWLVLILFFTVTVILFYSIFHLFHVLKNKALIYALFCGLIITEVVWILCFWPIEYFFSGFLVTIVFYILWGLTHHQFENTLSRKLVIEYLLVGGVIFFFVLKISLSAL